MVTGSNPRGYFFGEQVEHQMSFPLLKRPFHDVGGGTLVKQLVLHKVHVRGNMGEELPIILTKIVQARLAVGCLTKTVLRTAAVADKAPLADLALMRKALIFVASELQLSFAVHHRGDSVAVDVAQQVLGKNEVVARIDIAIVLNHPCMATGGAHGAKAGWLTSPAGQGGIEQLHEHLPHIVTHPLVEDGTAEMGILKGANHRNIHRRTPLNDRGKLNILAAYFLVEVIDIERMVGVVVVHHAHRVPLHAVFLQQAYATHHLVKGGLAFAITAIGIVQLLRPVNGDANEPVVLTKESAPFISEQRTISLQAVVDDVAPTSIGFLQFQHTLVETQRTQKGLASMPCEEHLRLRLCLNILADISLKCMVIHQH